MRTVKYDLKELQSFLKEYGVEIESKRSYGYRLLVGDGSDMEGLSKALQANLRKHKGEVFRYNFQRVIYIINKLLIGKPYYKAEELMDTFYISRSTLTQDLNRARTLLAKFRLEIDVNLRRGIGVTGDELDKRLCIAEYFFRYDDKAQVMVQRRADGRKYDWDAQRDTLVRIVWEACRANKIRLSPFLAVDLASHMYVSVLRMKAEARHRGAAGPYHDSGICEGAVRGRGGRGSAGKTLFRIDFREKSGEYFALHILSKKMPDSRPVGSGEHATLKQCVTEIMREVKDNFELDFTNDPVFLDFLDSSIEPMVLRLRTHLIVRNPLLFENLRRYLFATKRWPTRPTES